MKTFCIEFTEQQLAVLNEALVNMPYRHAVSIISHINAEIQKSFDRRVDERDLPTGAPIDVSES